MLKFIRILAAIALACAACAATAANAQAQLPAVRVPNLPSAPAPVSGVDKVVCLQGGVVYTCPMSQIGGDVANNAALMATASTSYAQLTRLAVSILGDSPPVLFKSSNLACALNAGAGDAGSQVPSSDSKCWIAVLPSPADVRIWGAVCDNAVTDDNTPLAAAFAYSGANSFPLSLPPKSCLSSAFQTIGGNGSLTGAIMTPTNPPTGSGIVCPAAIANACLKVGTVAGLDGASVSNLTVSYSGTPIAGDSALLVRGFNSKLTDVLAFNAYDGFTFQSGIAAHLVRPYTFNIYRYHIVQNGFSEIYITSGHFGMNGSGDQAASTAFFGFTGSDPNTFNCTDCQASLGAGVVPKYLFDFFSLGSQINGFYSFVDSLVDMSSASATAIIHGDGTGGPIRMTIANSTILGGSAPFFSVGAGAMNAFDINNSFLGVGTFALPNTTAYSGLRLANLNITGSCTFDGASGSDADISNVRCGGAMIVQGGTWLSLHLAGLSSGTSYIDSAATGAIFAVNTPPTTWTPQLNFGGAHVGMTSSSALGSATRNADGTVSARFGIQLTATGSSTGAATITGNPYTCAASSLGQITLRAIFANNMAGLTGTIVAWLNQTTTTINISMNGATGQTALTHASFTNTSLIATTPTCVPQ